ncbi:MAG: nitroreductase family protein [Brevinematales bacterium]|nr:nitroreductase family protein [Brevinematales bacterium]
MDFKKLVMKNRSYRRFFNHYKISKNTLLELIDLARLTPSAKNLQPLKYFISYDEKTNQKIFDTLSWAGYLKTGGIDIEPEERPSAYIIILGDKRLADNFLIDAGIAAQTILLGAVNKGLGGCIVATIKRDKLKELIPENENYEILIVVALGKPKEKVVIETVKDNDVKYWRENLTHHVPKRSLTEVLLNDLSHLP